MFRNILNTTIVKIVNALVTFAVLLINARMLGPENLGTIGLILLAITIILLLNNLIGGGALVFLVPRYSLKRITLISYAWNLVATLAGIGLFILLKIEPYEYVQDILLLSLIFGFNFVNQNILIGKGLIRYFNLITFVQYMLMILLIILFFYILNLPSIRSYLFVLYITWGVQLVMGSIRVMQLLPGHSVNITKGLMKALLRYGVFVQIANLTQFFNYRLTYYFVESYLGRARLGVFEIGNKFADGIWLFARSISLVQYSWIANASEKDDTVTLTLRLFRFSLVLSLLLAGVLVALPESFYLSLFGAKFTGIHTVLLCLAPAIVFMSASMIIAHYFAGIGKHYINTIGSVLGLGFVVLFCFLLVPGYGLAGAALAASLTNLLTGLYHVIIFRWMTGIRWAAFGWSSDDYAFLSALIKKQLIGKSNNKD